jgi:hypothetical protein
LMENIKALNDGDEIGGWLLGDWKDDGDKMSLVCDKFFIPKQQVSSAEVDISPESMVETIKELGIEQSNRIKAHWHIHPFGTGDTSWSSTDETKIKDFMSPEKQREVFVFFLSSIDKIKARVEMNFKATCLGKTFTIRQSHDDIPVYKETSVNKTGILSRLKELIKDKITRPVNKTLNEYYYNGDKCDKPKKEELERYEVIVKGKTIVVKMDYLFGDWVVNKAVITPEMMSYKAKHEKKGKIVLVYESIDAETFADFIENSLMNLEVQYDEFGMYPYQNRYAHEGGWDY